MATDKETSKQGFEAFRESKRKRMSSIAQQPDLENQIAVEGLFGDQLSSNVSPGASENENALEIQDKNVQGKNVDWKFWAFVAGGIVLAGFLLWLLWPRHTKQEVARIQAGETIAARSPITRWWADSAPGAESSAKSQNKSSLTKWVAGITTVLVSAFGGWYLWTHPEAVPWYDPGEGSTHGEEPHVPDEGVPLPSAPSAGSGSSNVQPEVPGTNPNGSDAAPAPSGTPEAPPAGAAGSNGTPSGSQNGIINGIIDGLPSISSIPDVSDHAPEALKPYGIVTNRNVGVAAASLAGVLAVEKWSSGGILETYIIDPIMKPFRTIFSPLYWFGFKGEGKESTSLHLASGATAAYFIHKGEIPFFQLNLWNLDKFLFGADNIWHPSSWAVIILVVFCINCCIGSTIRTYCCCCHSGPKT